MALILLNSCTNKKLELSSDEKDWLQINASNIVVPFGYSAPPNAYFDENGDYKGLLVDFKAEIESQLHTEFAIKEFTTWNELIDYSKNAENYVIVGIARTAERETYLHFTNSFIKIPYVLITRKNSEISTIDDLEHKTFCTTKAYAINEYLQKNYPTLQTNEVNSDLEGIRAVSSGTYDAMVTNQMYATHIIEQEGFTNLKIAGESGYSNHLAAAVSKNNPTLYAIIDKAVDHISIAKQKELYRKWIYKVSSNFSRNIAYLTLILTACTLFAVFVMWLWLRYLRVQVEKKTKTIRRNEERYRSLIENSNDAIYILHKGKFILVNKKFEDLFDYTADELKADDFDTVKLIAPESRDYINQRNIDISENKEISQNYEFVGLTKGKKKIHLEVSVSFLELDDGIATQGIIHDITNRKTKELELLKAKEKAEESDRLKSAFLANMSHEIRTPMNGILGFADLLKSHNYSPEQQNKFIEIIKKSGNRMLSTINNIIDISKIESGVETIQTNEINIRVLITELYNFFLPEADQKGIELIVKVPNDSSNDVIYTDDYKLNSILTNLIKNALKFTTQGSITIGYSTTATHLKLNVIDTGRGIPKEKQGAIFDYFVQADNSTTRGYEGSGLGLSITKGYVDLLKGEIRMLSKPNIGTSFYVAIPIIQDNNEEAQPVTSTDEACNISSTNLKIIIAEDDSISADFLGLILHDVSSNILYAKNGIETIELLKQNPDTSLVLMDMKMPQMSGLDATREIRKFNAKVIIIAQTAFAKDGYRLKTIEAGCNDFLLKPINKEKLLRIISENLPVS